MIAHSAIKLYFKIIFNYNHSLKAHALRNKARKLCGKKKKKDNQSHSEHMDNSREYCRKKNTS